MKTNLLNKLILSPIFLVMLAPSKDFSLSDADWLVTNICNQICFNAVSCNPGGKKIDMYFFGPWPPTGTVSDTFKCVIDNKKPFIETVKFETHNNGAGHGEDHHGMICKYSL